MILRNRGTGLGHANNQKQEPCHKYPHQLDTLAMIAHYHVANVRLRQETAPKLSVELSSWLVCHLDGSVIEPALPYQDSDVSNPLWWIHS
jgi:hypothetical protein